MDASSSILSTGALVQVQVEQPTVKAKGHRPLGTTKGFLCTLRLFLQVCGIAALAVGSYFVFSHFVIHSVRVTGNSMLPTLSDDDLYLVNRLACLFRAPHCGDIVVLKDPTDQTQVVKRVIGGAGDVIELRDGAVYVNGNCLEEPYLLRGTRTYPTNSAKHVVQCGQDEYFVLGDNRGCSSDSRTYGLVRRSAILGLVMR